MATTTLLLLLLGLLLAMKSMWCTSENYKQLLLQLHNKLRRDEGSSNMNELTWDSVLEEEAKEWANGCINEHQYKGRGENLYFASYNWTTKKHIKTAMAGWFKEKDIYTYGQSSCSKSCHYTQLTWAETRRVGCAITYCHSLRNTFTDGNAWYLVCFYDPKGNMKGKKPYKTGRPCDGCRYDQMCHNKLCSGGTDPCDDLDAKCDMFVEKGLCATLRSAMEFNCKKSCDFCTGQGKKINLNPKTASGICKDRDPGCKHWARRGGCGAPFMQIKCKMSCDLCPGKKKIKQKIQAKKQPDTCTDESKNCPYWKSIGYCEKNRNYMMLKCKKSCDACRGGSRASCTDTNRNCGRWARGSRCGTNAYMNLNCKKSCKLC